MNLGNQLLMIYEYALKMLIVVIILSANFLNYFFIPSTLPYLQMHDTHKIQIEEKVSLNFSFFIVSLFQRQINA